MKDLGMDPSKESTHYLITMTTFADHSLAETWNFVASITGTQVFTCAMNFKLYVQSTVKKKEKKEKHLPLCLHSYRKVCWYKMCHSAVPFSSQFLHAGRGPWGSPFVPSPCYSAAHTEGTLQGKPLAAKTQDNGEKKNKPTPCTQSYSPGLLFPFKLWPTKWRRLGTILRKAPFPQENLLSPFQCVQPPSAPTTPHFPTKRLHITSSLLLELEENCSGEALPPFA